MPHRVRAALTRFRELFRHRARSAAERDEEFSLHMEMETAENIRCGMNDAEARRAAVLRFGGTQRFREETRDARGAVALDNLARDIRFAFRRLHRAPAFAAAVIATLGIGIGAAVGIGAIVYGVLLRDLPYDKPDQLVRVGFVTEGLGIPGDMNAPATYFHFVTQSHSFAALGQYYTNDAFNLTDGTAPERVAVAFVSPNALTMLGAHPMLGQLFEPGDTSWSNPRTAILISENLWRRRYGGDSSIIGRSIDINRGERHVIGVLPRSFEFPAHGIDIYYPAPVPVKQPQIVARGVNVIGRLRDGVDPRAAAAELNALMPSLSDRFPAITPALLQRSRARVTVESLKAATVAPVRPQLILLGVLVALVLLIATTNVVNLFLLRTERASHEIAIALSLGASRLALAQRFVVEGIVLGMASVVVALPVAALAVSTKFGFTEREIPRLHEVSLSWQTVALVFGCAALIGGGVGLIALTRAGVASLFDRLRAGRATSTRGWRRAQSGLVAFQVAMALVLLVASALLGRSFWNLRNANIGFDPANAMTFQVSLPWNGYTTYTDGAIFHSKMIDRLAALPGVTGVAVSTQFPLSGRGASSLDVQLHAGDDATRPPVSAAGNLASADYFKVMGIPLRAGRTFRAGDLHGTPAVIVSERLAKNVFGTTDVLGRMVEETFAGHAPRSFAIVGLVGDVHGERIEDGYVPMVYFPLQRDGDGIPADSSVLPGARPMDVQYVLRGTQLPTASTIQEIVKGLDRRIPPTNIRTLGSLVDDATARVRLTMLLVAIAGAAALLLGVIGVYGVVAYAANERMREFGIRLALGAAPVRVAGLVLGDGFRLIATGALAGFVAALGATRFLRALLYEVQPTSAAEFGIATALVVVVTLCATLPPARRAARTHPGVVLRGE
jgi:putative ABC transport system permease protein